MRCTQQKQGSASPEAAIYRNAESFHTAGCSFKVKTIQKVCVAGAIPVTSSA